MKRRTFLKGTLATGALSVAVGAGLLQPRTVMAAWPQSAFDAKKVEDALSAITGSSSAKSSSDITIKAPDIAENGAVVPVTISTGMGNIQTISILVAENPQPLAASFDLTDSVKGFVSTRIKMGKTSDVIAVVKTSGGAFESRKTVKVTIGGCGG